MRAPPTRTATRRFRCSRRRPDRSSPRPPLVDAGDTSEFSACVTVPAAPPTADLALTMTDSADPVAFGTPFNYVLTAQNLGPTAGRRRADHRHAAGRADRDGRRRPPRAPARSATSSVTCNIGTLGVNATATVTITVTSSVSGTVTNTAIDPRETQRSGAWQQLGQRADHHPARVVQRRHVHRADALCRLRGTDGRRPPRRHEPRRPARCRRHARDEPRRRRRVPERRRRSLRCAAVHVDVRRPGSTSSRTSTGTRTPT